MANVDEGDGIYEWGKNVSTVKVSGGVPGPIPGQYYCNNTPSQGSSCMLITTAGNGGGNGWIPGNPAQIEISLVLSTTSGPFYNTLQACEAVCSNHYCFNCWTYNNGNSSPNVSFPHLTTAEKNHFCIVCQNDVAGSLIKSHPYCWCLDNGTGLHTNPPASKWSLAPYVYTCPSPPFEPNMIVNCCDPSERYVLDPTAPSPFSSTPPIYDQLTVPYTTSTLGVGIVNYQEAFAANLYIDGGIGWLTSPPTPPKCWHLVNDPTPFGPTALSASIMNIGKRPSCAELNTAWLASNPIGVDTACCTQEVQIDCETPFAKLEKLTSKLDKFTTWKNKSLGK